MTEPSAQGRRAEIRSLRADLAAANAELLRRERFMAAVLETIEVGIVFCGPDGTGWSRNRAGRLLLGLDDAQGRSLDPNAAAPLITVRDTSGAPVAVNDYPVLRALRGEQVGEVELLLGPAGGPHREVVSRNSRIVDAQGAVLGAVTALTDVTPERTAIRAVADQHRRLTEAQRIGRLGSFELDLATDTWSVSDQLCALWGLPADRWALVSDTMLHPDDREATRSWWSTAVRQGGRHTAEFRMHRGDDGTERRIRCSVEVDLEDGSSGRVRGTHLDITELTAAEQAARDASAFMSAVLTASPDYTFIVDLGSGALVYGSQNHDVLGRTSEELAALGDDPIATLVHPEDVEKLRGVNLAAAGMIDGTVLAVRYRARHTDGQWHWLSRRVTPFKRNAAGVVVQILGVLRDVTDAVAAEDRLTHASLHDSLTGLPNRTLLMDRLQGALARSTRAGREVTVLFLDLDGFKQVNDSAGHAAGDAVLKETGARITSALREGDTVARIGGDEFVMVIEPRAPRTAGSWEATEAADRSTASQIAARVAAAVRRPISYDGVLHVVTASIGMTFAGGSSHDRHGTEPEEVLKRADDLMYRAKARGKDRVEV